MGAYSFQRPFTQDCSRTHAVETDIICRHLFLQDMLYSHDFTLDLVWHFAQDQGQSEIIGQVSQGRSQEMTKQNCKRYIEEQVCSGAEGRSQGPGQKDASWKYVCAQRD